MPPAPSRPTTISREWVEQQLIAAFHALPNTPVYGSATTPLTLLARPPTHPATAALNWAGFLSDDLFARKVLWSWARCRATGASFGALCRELGWRRTTAEEARRRGATTIARFLNLVGPDVSTSLAPPFPEVLDIRKIAIGASAPGGDPGHGACESERLPEAAGPGPA